MRSAVKPSKLENVAKESHRSMTLEKKKKKKKKEKKRKKRKKEKKKKK
jgi:hypothetical protein